MTVMVLLFLGGAVGMSFSLLAMQMLELRRNMVRLQADVRRLTYASQGALQESDER